MPTRPARLAAFTIDRKTFADAVGRIARYVPDRAPVPVLRGILVTAHCDGVELLATDYDETARLLVDAEVDAIGRFLVDGVHLARIARNLPGGTARVEVDGSVVTLTGGRATFRLLTMPEQDYPNMDEVDSVPLDRVKPAPADGHERGLTLRRGLALVKMWRAPARSRTPYEPADLQPGAWITWARHHRSGAYGTIHETEEIRGQVWSVADGPRAVWAIPEGERRPVRVEEGRHSKTLDECAESTASVVRRRALAEGTILVEAEELLPGDVIVGAELRSAYTPLDKIGQAQWAGSVVESAGAKRKRGNFRGEDTYETPVKLAGDQTMIVHDFHAVRVIRPAAKSA